MTLTRRHFLATATACAAWPAFAAGTHSFGGPAFGSYWRATLPEGADSAAISAVIGVQTAHIDALMSPYRATSDLGRFNRAATSLELALETAQVTAAGLALAQETGGAFDPTVGPEVARLGFGPIRGSGPSGHAGLTLSGTVLQKAHPGLTLDLCGIAKGHALDRIVAELEALGHSDFVLELGGEVAARGLHPSGRPWQIAIEAAGTQIVALGDTAVATSGGSLQGYTLGAHRYGHIIDPRSGSAAAGGLASVSVFHRSALRADALATALFAMGRDEAEDFAARQGIEAVLIGTDGRVIPTAGAGARLLGRAAP